MAGTHTHETNSTLHAHKQSNQSPEEKRWVLRAELNDTRDGRYIFVIRCDAGGMVFCMMWNVCGLDGLECEMDVCDLGGLQSVKWCRMVWWRKAYGVKWWREIAVWCGMPWCDFLCFVIWIYKVMCSVRSSLLFLYYVVFSVMSVQYCLCVSRIQCTQCSVSVYWASAQFYDSVQCK